MHYEFQPREMTRKEYAQDSNRRTLSTLCGIFSGVAGGLGINYAARHFENGVHMPDVMAVSAFALASLGLFFLSAKKSEKSVLPAFLAGVLIPLMPAMLSPEKYHGKSAPETAVTLPAHQK